MSQYLFAMYQPQTGVPAPDVLASIMAQLGDLAGEMRAAGAVVTTAGLAPAATATTLRPGGGTGATGTASTRTDGPFAETAEHLGGFWLVEGADRATAETWAERVVEITGLPVEVRQVVGRG